MSDFTHPPATTKNPAGAWWVMGPTTLAHPQEPRPASPTTTVAVPPRLATPSGRPASRIVVPVRYSAWLTGDLGRALERTLRLGLDVRGRVRITRLPRAFVLEADEEPGILLEAVHRSAVRLEHTVEQAYPVLHQQIGPVWTGTLQSVFDSGEAAV